MKKIIILVADKDMEFCVKGILPRLPATLALTEQFSYEIFTHPMHDPGCRTHCHEFLRPFVEIYDYCIVMFDYEGSGGETANRKELVETVKRNLSGNGWENRHAVIVIEPEIENWMWVKSPHLAKAMNWKSLEELDKWLLQNNYKTVEEIKPKRPKEAFLAALRFSKKRLSPSIYEDIAREASFKHCIDEAFGEFKAQFIAWFQ